MFIFEIFQTKTSYRITDLTEAEINYFYDNQYKYRPFKLNNVKSDDDTGLYLVRSGNDG